MLRMLGWLEKIWEDAVVAYFEVESQYLEELRKNHRNMVFEWESLRMHWKKTEWVDLVGGSQFVGGTPAVFTDIFLGFHQSRQTNTG
jgi:hypothetical protein